MSAAAPEGPAGQVGLAQLLATTARQAEGAPSAPSLLRRFGSLKSERGNFEAMWQEIADHILGRRQFVDKSTPGRKRMQRIYDTTGAESVELLSAALHSLLTNTESRWFGITLEDVDLAKDPDSMIWLENTTERMRAEFDRPDAGFTPQAHEMYYDLVAFGTGAKFITDKPGSGAMFSARPLAETYISENVEGRVDTVFRQFEMTHRAAVEMWGPEAPRIAVKGIETGRHEEKAQYLHVVLPNDRVIPGNLDFSGMPFVSVYLDMKEKDFIQEPRGFWNMPYVVPRWNKDSGEIYGRGPGVVALADAKMLNEISRTTLKGAMKAVDPPGFIPNDGIMSNLNLVPGGMSVFDQGYLERSRGNPIVFAPPASNIGLGVQIEERRAMNVRRAFHHELLQMFEDPRMTATQVLELSRTAQRLLSPVLGRQRVEYLEPMLERVFGIMLRSGKFLPPPDILQGQNIRIDYVSPVSRAQKADESNAVTRVLAQAVELSAVAPEIMDNFDLDASIRFIAESNAIPSRIMQDPRVMQQIREKRAQLAAEREKFALMNQAMETGAKLSAVPRDEEEAVA